jgi:hypothetical protein
MRAEGLACLEDHKVSFPRAGGIKGYKRRSRFLAVFIHRLHQQKLQALEAFHLLRAHHPPDHASQLHMILK